jgi:hypothetical protein
MITFPLRKFTIDVHNNTITIPEQGVDIDLLNQYGFVDLSHEDYDLIIIRLVNIYYVIDKPLPPYNRLTIDVCDKYDPYFVYQRIEHQQPIS